MPGQSAALWTRANRTELTQQHTGWGGYGEPGTLSPPPRYFLFASVVVLCSLGWSGTHGDPDFIPHMLVTSRYHHAWLISL